MCVRARSRIYTHKISRGAPVYYKVVKAHDYDIRFDSYNVKYAYFILHDGKAIPRDNFPLQRSKHEYCMFVKYITNI